MTSPASDFGYPEGYRDPEWDGTLAQYRDIVLPARMDALKQSMDAVLADAGFPDLHFEWVTGDEP
jgi:hypothetical protein